MLALPRILASALVCGAMALASVTAVAAPSQVVTQVTQFGLLALPYTTSIGQSVSPLAAPYAQADYFVSDYGFHIGDSGSFSSAVVTFELGQVLQLSDLSMRLLQGSSPWAGLLPTALSVADIAARNANTLVWSTGNAITQVIDPVTLAAGNYVLEVRGRVTGSAGGSYGGVFNVAAVPEPSGLLLALGGLACLGLVKRRAKH